MFGKVDIMGDVVKGGLMNERWDVKMGRKGIGCCFGLCDLVESVKELVIEVVMEECGGWS